MKNLNKKFIILYFNIGVNVIGLPEIHKHEIGYFGKNVSNFHK